VAPNGIQKQRQVVLCAIREIGQYPSPNTLRATFTQKQVWLLRVTPHKPHKQLDGIMKGK
jgi:hypothetical protein